MKDSFISQPQVASGPVVLPQAPIESPAWLLRVPSDLLSSNAKLVYGNLYAWSKGGIKADRGAKEVGLALGISLRKVARAMRQLKEVDLIETTKRFTGYNDIALLSHPWMSVDIVSEKPQVENITKPTISLPMTTTGSRQLEVSAKPAKPAKPTISLPMTTTGSRQLEVSEVILAPTIGTRKKVSKKEREEREEKKEREEREEKKERKKEREAEISECPPCIDKPPANFVIGGKKVDNEHGMPAHGFEKYMAKLKFNGKTFDAADWGNLMKEITRCLDRFEAFEVFDVLAEKGWVHICHDWIDGYRKKQNSVLPSQKANSVLPWEEAALRKEEVEKRAKEALSSRGIFDPRLSPLTAKQLSSLEHYDALKNYDVLLATEVIKPMKASTFAPTL